MSWPTGPWSALAVTTAAKAGLMYGSALLLLRAGERRTLAQWTLIDVVAAVALGAIVGRTAVAETQSYATGAVALATVVTVHRLASLLRFSATCSASSSTIGSVSWSRTANCAAVNCGGAGPPTTTSTPSSG